MSPSRRIKPVAPSAQSDPHQPAPPSGPVAADADELTAIELVSDGRWSDLVINGADIAGRRADNVSFDRVRLMGTNLARSRWVDLRLMDVVLVACDLSNTVIDGPSFVRVEFHDCRLTGTSVEGGHFKDVRFVSCNGEGVAMMDVSAERLVIEDCRWPEADMRAAKLADLSVARCRMPRSEWIHARLDRARFTETDLSAVKGPSGLRGASIDAATLAYAAPALAAGLGITVRESEPSRDDA